jgi:hypothetical protein
MRTTKAKSPTKASPKPPPGSAESIRRQTAELESATALLKEARPTIERELGLDQPQATLPVNGKNKAPTEPLFHARGERSWELATRDAFDRAYSRWLAARAAQETVEEHEAAAKVYADLAAAEREVVLTPALYDWMVWRKLEILSLIVEDDLRNGERADNFSLIALAAIKSDLIGLGIGGGQ